MAAPKKKKGKRSARTTKELASRGIGIDGRFPKKDAKK